MLKFEFNFTHGEKPMLKAFVVIGTSVALTGCIEFAQDAAYYQDNPGRLNAKLAQCQTDPDATDCDVALDVQSKIDEARLVAEQVEIARVAVARARASLANPASGKFSGLFVREQDNLTCGYVQAQDAAGNELDKARFAVSEDGSVVIGYGPMTDDPDGIYVNQQLSMACAR